jgi:hypothetical protein
LTSFDTGNSRLWPDDLSALPEARFQEKRAREHGLDGFLVQPGDVKEAARYAIEILSRADRGREMGQTASINAKKHSAPTTSSPPTKPTTSTSSTNRN